MTIYFNFMEEDKENIFLEDRSSLSYFSKSRYDRKNDSDSLCQFAAAQTARSRPVNIVSADLVKQPSERLSNAP